jgi:hypothetical protein
MSLEEAETNRKKKQFKEGSVNDLTERLEILDHKIQGRFLTLAPNAGRLVEVKFMDAEGEEQLTGHVEKWSTEGDLWVMVPKDTDKSEFKHYRLSPEQNISSRLVNLNK